MRNLFLAGVALASISATSATAAVFKPFGATASSVAGSAYAARFTIDGSGLSSPTDITAAHADYADNNHWTSDGSGPLDEFIDWTFLTSQTIGAAYIWNHRSNIIAANSGYEPTLFDLTLFDGGNNVLLSLTNVALAPDNAFAQRIDFALVNNVSRVRFDVQAVQSSPNFTGLAEVAFDTQSFVTPGIPEPATWAMMIGGFGLLGAAARRRRTMVLA